MHRLTAALSLLVVCFISAPALQPAAAAEPYGSAARTEHCVQDLSDGIQRCFATFTEAIAVATDGAVTDAPEQAAEAMADPTFARRIEAADAVGAASSVLGISWEHINYGGSSVSWTASYGCDDYLDVDWQVGNVGSTWNDRISSAQSFSHCQSKYWENQYYTGSSTSWFTNASLFGTMNDKATSIQFR